MSTEGNGGSVPAIQTTCFSPWHTPPPFCSVHTVYPEEFSWSETTVSLIQMILQSSMALWTFILTISSSSLFSRDWTLARRMLGNGERFAFLLGWFPDDKTGVLLVLNRIRNSLCVCDKMLLHLWNLLTDCFMPLQSSLYDSYCCIKKAYC